MKKGSGNAISRLYKLLIPFTFWSTIYFIIIADFKSLSLAGMISKHWTGYGWSGQYYFIILFQLLLLFGTIRWITLRLEKFTVPIYILSVLFYSFITYSHWFEVGIIGKVSYRPFIYWVPYVMLGVLYAHKNIFRVSLPLGAALLSPILILIEVYLLKPPLENVYMLPSVFISSLALLSSMNSRLTYAGISPNLGKLIQSLANYTLGIFCLNPLVIITMGPIIKKIGLVGQFPGSSVGLSIASTLFITGCCILIINILKRIRLGILVAN